MSSFWPFLLFYFLLIFHSTFQYEEESSIDKSQGKMNEHSEIHEFDGAGCGMTKGCLMKPKDCTPGKDCIYAMSFVADDERIYFELMAQVSAERNSYVALGFSVDGLMGGDTVTDCSSFEGGPFSAHLSYNPGKSNRKVPLEAEKEAQILSTHFAKYSDGLLYCRFSQLIHPPATVQTQFVRPLNSPIFILISTGQTHNQELAIHSLNADSPLFPFSSSIPVQLTEYKISPGNGWQITSNGNSSNGQMDSASTTTSSSIFITQNNKIGQEFEGEGNSSLAQQKAHGVLMLICWLLLAPFAILSARFLHHEKIELFGLHLWFQIHRVANSLAFSLILISLLCILASLDSEWIGPTFGKGYEENLSVRSLHALFGAIAILFTICQPINALFRCAPNSPARFIFGWLHSIIGYSAWLFSAISISIACFFFNNKFFDWFIARDLLIASLTLIIVSFSVLQWFSYRRKCQLAKGTQIGGEMAINERHKEGLLIQRAIVGLFLVVASILCLALSLLLILA